VIVIVGSPAWRAAGPPGPSGRACRIALSAAARGSRVELVGRVGEDRAGEALLIALANAGIGHAAILRDPTRPTQVVGPVVSVPDDDHASPLGEPAAAARSAIPAAGFAGARLEGADVDLAIKYLEPSGVMVVADDVSPEAREAAVAAAGYAQLRLVVVLASERRARTVPVDVPEDATVLVAPDGEADDAGAFETLVGAYAAALDSGTGPAAAFATAQGATGWEMAPAD
jgi:sugar/nucleoside kinase (ribokinase family)